LFDYRIFRFFRRNVTAAAALRWLKTSSLWTYRTVLWTVLAVVFVCASVVLSLRYWVLPNIDTFRPQIERVVSEATHQHISIGRISGNWDGLRPRLVLEGVTVYDKADRPALRFSRVDSTLSWRSAAIMRVSFHALDIYQPMLDVRRDAKGTISVAGIELDTQQTEGGGFVAWLLDQPDIELHDAGVVWTDDLRAAPPHALQHVTLHLVNRGRRHRFGLQAQAPAEIARGLDVRGDLRGRTLDALAEWNGRLFLQLDYIDIAAWRQWVDFPVEFPRGSGALRTWLTFSNDELTEVTADVRLAGVRTRLRADLPELELDSLSGRFGWKTTPTGFEVSSTGLALAASRPDVALRPADVLLRVARDKSGAATSGELRANTLDLAPLAMLADRLPLDEAARKDLAQLDPRGRVDDLLVKWTGRWSQPESYSAHARFYDLAAKRWKALPGVAGVSGTVEASEKGGSANLEGEHALLDLPSVFKDVVRLDRVKGQVGWTLHGGELDLRVHSLNVANADLAGSVSGTYRRRAAGDEMDFTGSLTRADARAVARYLPVDVLKDEHKWFQRALVAGTSPDVKFHVKGRVADFPYPDNKGGVFTLTAKLSGGVLDYADGWPRIEGITGQLEFRGRRMDVLASQAKVYGVRLAKVQATIPNLDTHTPLLTVTGEAEGPTSDFLAFIAKSPVSDMLDHFTDNARAQGRGRLSLKLTLPLANLKNTRVAGAYQFLGDNVIVDSSLPGVDQLTGRLEFTDSSVRIPGATGVFLGGPVTISANTQRDGVIRMSMQGRINADNVRKLGSDFAIMQHLRGATDWRGSFTVRDKTADLVIESSLQGIASVLPAPFAKSPGETIPLRIERRHAGAQQRVSISYGNIAAAQLVLRTEGGKSVIDRGTVRFGGGAAPEPDKPGVWATGTVKFFDFDEWLKFAGEGESAPAYALSGIDVKIGEMDVFSRRLHDLAISATSQAGGMRITARAKELESTGTWHPQGKGRITARLKRLIVPAAETRLTELQDKPPPGTKPPELPALDIVAESFQLGQKQLGRLELSAVHENRDWRIERLRVTNADSSLQADGVWQSWLTQPRTRLTLRFDVSDIGKTLTRLGYPEGVRGGTAKIEGTLSWIGSPQEFDYPTLSGNLVIDAARGQFAKLDPGIAKLLGILSLQALPRRNSLDFRDISSEGFAFDAIVGAVKIDRGVASTENLRIQGPSALVVMTGSVDLARETQNLKVRVNPHLSESVSLAGALIGGPVAGVAAYLAQKILKDPLEQIAGFDYAITGTWSDPQVAKLERAAPRETQETPP
jgi:uncharacterized protein (TIGR02099 family)